MKDDLDRRKAFQKEGTAHAKIKESKRNSVVREEGCRKRHDRQAGRQDAKVGIEQDAGRKPGHQWESGTDEDLR